MNSADGAWRAQSRSAIYSSFELLAWAYHENEKYLRMFWAFLDVVYRLWK